MKKVVLLSVLATAFVAVADMDVSKIDFATVDLSKLDLSKIDRRKLSKEQRDILFERKMGGFVMRPIEGRLFRVVNEQKDLPLAELKACLGGVVNALRVPLDLVDGDTPPKSDAKVGFTLTIKDDAASSVRMSCSPDDGFGVVNVAMLKKDNPDKEVLRKRIIRMVWRTIVYSLGGGNTENPICPMKPAVTMKDLDELVALSVCPEPFPKMMATLQALGIKENGRATYRRACREGWAPAPTNDYQRAILDEERDPKKRFEKDFPGLKK